MRICRFCHPIDCGCSHIVENVSTNFVSEGGQDLGDTISRLFSKVYPSPSQSSAYVENSPEPGGCCILFFVDELVRICATTLKDPPLLRILVIRVAL
jgi:hypothetical protein